MWPFSSYRTITTKQLNEYDYIIVGGGTAGCVLASRLSQSTNSTVLLIERGSIQSNTRAPYLVNFPEGGSLCEKRTSIPQTNIGEREIEFVLPQVLGGKTKINDMLYSRPSPLELDNWSKQGLNGWSWNEIFPYFLKSENAISVKQAGSFHNTKGEWKNRTYPPFYKCSDSFTKSAVSLGFPAITDLNDSSQSLYGVGPCAFTIDENSRRCDVATAFLPSSLVKKRQANLDICPSTLVIGLKIVTTGTKIVVKGVIVQNTNDKNGAPIEVLARKEVILCAGAIGTPQLLMLSGIGPRHHLASQGIQVNKDLPGVGSALQDHLCVPLKYLVPIGDSVDILKYVFIDFGQSLQFSFSGRGVKRPPPGLATVKANSQMINLISNQVVKEGIPNSDPQNPANIPDIEITACAFGTVDSKGNVDKDIKGSGGFSLHVKLASPLSMGTVELKSTDPRDTPVCDPNYFGNRKDRTTLYTGIRLAMHLKETMAKFGYSITDHSIPIDTTEPELDKFIAQHAYSPSQFSSTCRMAPENKGGVVDAELKVYGVQGLRIAGSCIFSTCITSAHQAMVVAVAEKCSDLILKAYASPTA